MTEPVLVLQHIACEPPAAYEDELVARGIALHRVEIDEGEPLPDWRAFSGIVAMGGPMGAYEDERLPWLVAEKALIAEAVREGTPYWGVCLGAQLLASSLGARVYPGPQAEVGMLPVTLTAQARHDPVFAQAPGTFAADSLCALLGRDGLAQLTAGIGEYEQRSIAIARSLFSRWLEQVVGAPRPPWRERSI